MYGKDGKQEQDLESVRGDDSDDGILVDEWYSAWCKALEVPAQSMRMGYTIFLYRDR